MTTDTTPPSECPACGCTAIDKNNEYPDTNIMFACGARWFIDLRKWRKDCSSAFSAAVQLRERLDDVNVKDSVKTREINILVQENRELRQQLEQATNDNAGLLQANDALSKYNLELIAENEQARAERDAALARADKIATRLGDIVLEDDALRAQAAPAPLGGVVWAAARLVEECRDAYNITLGAYMCEPILFQGLVKVVDALTAMDAPAQSQSDNSSAQDKTTADVFEIIESARNFTKHTGKLEGEIWSREEKFAWALVKVFDELQKEANLRADMIIAQQDAPAQGWRLLSEGEVIQAGDESWSHGQWHEIFKDAEEVGMPYGGYWPVRRRVALAAPSHEKDLRIDRLLANLKNAQDLSHRWATKYFELRGKWAAPDALLEAELKSESLERGLLGVRHILKELADGWDRRSKSEDDLARQGSRTASGIAVGFAECARDLRSALSAAQTEKEK